MAITDILDLAEKFEIQGYEFYNSKKNGVKNSVARETFEFLANMENEHTKYIRNMRKSLEEDLPILEVPGDTTNDFFENRLKSQKLDEVPKESDMADLSILRMALLIEKDFVNYYSKAVENTKDEKLKTMFELLEKWERGHVKLIEDLIGKILDRNRLDLGFYPF